MIRKFLQEYCSRPFVTGFERACGDFLPEAFAPYTNRADSDNRGSYIFTREGRADRVIMVEAHVDEIGFMVTQLLPGGFLGFLPAGYYNALCLVAQEVVIYGRKEIGGVICPRPGKEPEEGPVRLKTDWLYIDTGYSDEELSLLVKPGDVIVLRQTPFALLENWRTARAWDDKAGVAAMLEAARRLDQLGHTSTVHFVAAVQEEGPGLGAKLSAYKLAPDLGIVLDVGHAYAPGLPPGETLRSGKGPAIAMGGRFHPVVVGKFAETAEKHGIPHQFEVVPASSGTDAESVQVSRDGVPCALLSIPLRYMHTPVETGDLRDVEWTGELIAQLIHDIDVTGWEGPLC